MHDVACEFACAVWARTSLRTTVLVRCRMLQDRVVGCFVFDLSASFSSFGVLCASIFVLECFVFDTTV